jgi:hypothetical protein
VTFEDGRTGNLAADVRIYDAEVYPVKTISRDAA